MLRLYTQKETNKVMKELNLNIIELQELRRILKEKLRSGDPYNFTNSIVRKMLCWVSDELKALGAALKPRQVRKVGPAEAFVLAYRAGEKLNELLKSMNSLTTKKETMKPLEITIEQAREIFEDNGTPYMEAMKLHFGLEVLNPKPKRSTCFEDLIGREGFYLSSVSNLLYQDIKSKLEKNIFATKEQAEAVLALAQLSQHMAIWNDGWVADWVDSRQPKFVIKMQSNGYIIATLFENRGFLSFENIEIAEEFLKTFKDLIEQAKPLL